MAPRDLRQIELYCGVAAGVLGILLPGYAILFASYQLVEEVGGPITILVQIVITLIIGVTAYFDARFPRLLDTGVGFGLAVLWTAVAALWGFLLFADLTINVYTLPAAVLGLISVLAGSWAQYQVTQAEG
ncbi:MAG TPA: hypothetical protein VNG11_02165 [Chloroflexota bacterium]|nr:hypothetical protein [Chloroflexota bacterium]